MEHTNNTTQQQSKLKTFYNECIRVLKVTKKPDKIEFMTVAKVSGIGLLIIGLIGFILFAIAHILTQ